MERKTKHAATLKTFLGHYYNASFLYLVIILVFYPFIQSILGYNRGTVIRQPLEPACQNKCVVSVPHSSVDKFASLSLDSTQVLFVHFSGYNLSLEPSDNNADILDPLNLVWVDSIEAPFLSLDLDFIVYSFTTLSRIINHMKVNVDVEPINCLQNLSHSCVTANLARTFLGNVTLERGVLCYAVNDSNTVNYRCCKGNVHTQQVECDIPAVLNSEMAKIFITIVIAAAITLLCLPALFNIVPDKKKSETLRFNSQVQNPLYRLVICAVQAIRYFSTKYYCANVVRNLLIVLALPTLCYVDLGLLSYTKTHEIPKMFNDSVKNLLVASKGSITLFVIVTYNLVGVLFSFLPKIEHLLPLKQEEDDTDLRNLMQLLRPQEKDIALNWLKPFVWIKGWFCLLRPFLEARNRFVAFFCSFVLMLLLPFVTILMFTFYIAYVSPLGKLLRTRVLYWFHVISILCFNNRLARLILFSMLLVFLPFFVYAFTMIIQNSLLLSARLIVYLWIGLVASKDYYFPRIAIISVFVYYSWNCMSSVTSRYQILLKQTFEKCKEHQEKYLNGRKALTFDDNGVPRISHKLFEHVIDQILPRSEVDTIMILKLTIIILFLVLTFSSILIYGKSSLNESTKALAVLMTGLLPKMFEVFGEGSSYWNLVEIENACRIEKIVKDFLSQTQDDANSNDGTLISHAEDQSPSNPSGDQLPTTSINKRNRPTLEGTPVPKTAHSNVRSKKSIDGNSRNPDEHLLVVRLDVNPRVQSINSCNSDDPSTEETVPSPLGQSRNRMM